MHSSGLKIFLNNMTLPLHVLCSHGCCECWSLHVQTMFQMVLGMDITGIFDNMYKQEPNIPWGTLVLDAQNGQCTCYVS